MSNKLRLFTIPVIFFVSACSQNLVEDIYAHARHSEAQEMATAFAALANLSLSETDITSIEKDYKKEKNEEKRYYYEFLLAKRTQEKKYIEAFIESSSKNLSVLAENKTNWISIASPFYKPLSFYSKTNDDALVILLKLSQISDGSNLAVIAEDLSEIYGLNPERFLRVAGDAEFQTEDLLKLMEDE